MSSVTQVSIWIILSTLIVNCASNVETPAPLGFWPLTPQDGGKNAMATGDAVLINVQSVNGIYDSEKTALLLNGSPESYIRIPMHTLRKSLEGGSLTMTVYLYLESQTRGPILEIFNRHTSQSSFTFSLWPEYENVRLRHASSQLQLPAGTVHTKNWYYLAAVNDHIAQQMRFYKDNELVAETTYVGSAGPFDGEAFIGSTPRAHSVPNSLNARIFCLQIFNVALSRSQIIQSRENCSNQVRCVRNRHRPKPVGVWPFTFDSQGGNLMGTGSANLINVLPSYGLNDRVNSALYLKRSSNSYIHIPTNHIRKYLRCGSITITAYVYLESESTGPIMEFPTTDMTQIAIHFWVWNTFDKLHMSNQMGTLTSSPNILQLKKWHYLAAVNDNNAKWMGIYRDMVLVKETTYSRPVPPIEGDAYIGWSKRDGAENNYLDVRIFCVQIFNVALSRSEIARSRGTCLQSLYGCRKTVNGSDYNGNLDVTVSGIPCQKWQTHNPHVHPFSDKPDQFPDKSMEAVSNYCRNPNGRWRPWCYTTNPSIQWEYCNVPKCDE